MFMDFTLTEEQRDLQAMFRDFTDKEIRPRAKQMDETGEMDEELWGKMAEIGSFGITTPEEYGGAGMGIFELVLAMEECVKGCGTIYNWLASPNGHSSSCVLKFGTEEQKRKYVPPIVSGEEIGAFALTEPGAGSDAGSLMTKAVLEGDHFVINGSKTFITWASRASSARSSERWVSRLVSQ